MDSTQNHRRKCRRGDAARFILEALTYESDECLLWPYTVVGKGYGSLWWEGKIVGAHRLLCALAHGPVPGDGRWEAAHRCGVRICMNKRHIRWARPVENAADKIAHRTDNKGVKHGLAKLTEDQVRDIREQRKSATLESLAQRFNVSQTTIHRVTRGDGWVHVT